MRGAIDRPHPTLSEQLFDLVFIIEYVHVRQSVKCKAQRRGNKFMINLTTFALCFLFASLLVSGQDPPQKEPADPKYKVGQQWSYTARPGEEKSYLIIVKIDNDPKLGRIVHIALRGLKIKNPHSPDGISEEVNHMPFLESAIEKSGLKLLKEKVDLPEFEEGYQMWRQAHDAGKAGVFSVTVAEGIGAMETVVNR